MCLHEYVWEEGRWDEERREEGEEREMCVLTQTHSSFPILKVDTHTHTHTHTHTPWGFSEQNGGNPV